MAQTQQEIAPTIIPLDRILDNIHALGLDKNLIELETRGYTTIPKVLSEAQIEQAKESIIARAEQTTNKIADVDNETGEGYEGLTYLPYLLYDNEIFEEILLEPKPLALITYLLGESCYFQVWVATSKVLVEQHFPFTPTTVTAYLPRSPIFPRWQTSTMR